MGVSSSKSCSNEPLVLCRERTRCIKQAIDSRYALSAAHLSYIQSLKNVGTALRKFAEGEISIEPSISTSEPSRTPSRSSYASSFSLHVPEHLGSPFTKSPLPPQLSNMSCMKMSSNDVTSTFVINPSEFGSVEEDEIGSSWDFFDANDKDVLVPLLGENLDKSSSKREGEAKSGVDQSLEDLIVMATGESCISNMKKSEMEDEELVAEREDASEFITHRAKDFLSSMKDIEYRFLRAAETSDEVSRLLETSKIRLNVATSLGRSPSCQFLSNFRGVCCKAETTFKHESSQNLAKLITWNRSVSSLSSSSSKTPLGLGTASRDGDSESDCDFTEEFCMISGSHSSTLDRLYAWERKLYDEVKASEFIRKAYEQKCNQLRHQFSRNLNAQVIDKTRVVAKDLHSQIRVAIQSVDSISKKIEKIRDEELQPQLLELMQGLIRMWKAMLECHHTQFITISLAYHVMSSKPESFNESFKQALSHLHIEIDRFACSFTSLLEAHKSYIVSLNSWIHKCVLQSHEQKNRARRKAALFGPPRSLSPPPIFVLCQHWSDGIKSLNPEEFHDSIKGIGSILCDLANQQAVEDDDVAGKKLCRDWSLDCLKTGLTSLFDRLAKFSEASLKVLEEVRRVNETACNEYNAAGQQCSSPSGICT